MINLEPEQRQVVDKAKDILKKKNVVYIAAEPRTGKSPMGLMTAYESGFKYVLILTKKVAIDGLERFRVHGMFNSLVITNFEQAHKYQMMPWDIIIVDEAHSCGAFPKPTNRTKVIKEIVGLKPLILMSGTPTPESYSQIYHQFWLSQFGPFHSYKTFYKWAVDFVTKKNKYVGGFVTNDYSMAKDDMVKLIIKPYMVELSQEQAGFTSFVEEEIVYVDIDDRIYKLLMYLKRDKIYTFKNGVTLVCDTPVKLMSAFHQICSGTIKLEEEQRVGEVFRKIDHRLHLDTAKVEYIKKNYSHKKIAIYYKFIAEGEMLRKHFPNHTENQDDFERREDLIFIKQVVAGREGVDLATADYLIMYNIDYSATSYWQTKARLQTKKKTKQSILIWLFSRKGIEKKIYRAVVKKKSYTSNYFNKDMRSWNPFSNAA